MTWAELKNRIESENGSIIPVRARVEDTAASNDEEQGLIEAAMRTAHPGQSQAEVSPVDDSGRPRMLKLSAWIAHSGKPNRNGDAFRKEDLAKAVGDGLFVPPYVGMVDFNHDFEAYGVWYRAHFAYDPDAEAYGILAEGAIFAWRYTELADKLLAMQQRQGYIDFSMACIPKDIAYEEDEDGRRYAVLIEPVFFTTSALDVDPADPHANGRGTEGPAVEQDEETQKVLTRATQDALELERTWELTPAMLTAGTDTEDSMDMEQLLEALKEAVGEATEENAERLQALAEAAQQIPELKADLESAQETVSDLEEQLEAKTTEADELEVRLESVSSDFDAAKEELDELREFKQEIEEREAAEERKALKEARLSDLPESMRESFEDREEEAQDRILANWLDKSDEEWKEFIDLLPTTEASGSDESEDRQGRYKRRSEAEGTLPSFSDLAETEYEIDQFTR